MSLPKMELLGSSFKDPNGFMFREGGRFLRVVEASYCEHYERLNGSGLYHELVELKLLVPHEEVDARGLWPTAYKVLEPRQIEFISYPYEWCFHQLKDAALATLRIQKLALERGLNLKDASAFNIQFIDGTATLIDTLSFERLVEGKPWVAYRQFCEHFLAPLALMSYCDARLGRLSRIRLDGVPVDLASLLLPWRSTLKFGLLLHLHLHARSLGKLSRQAQKPVLPKRKCSLNSVRGLIQSLESAVQGLRCKPSRTYWEGYYGDDQSTAERYLAQKEAVISNFLDQVRPTSVWDLGANTGRFSRLASGRHIPTWAFDADHDCVDRNYLQVREKQEPDLLPLWLDLANPSPGLGWEHDESMAWMDRGEPGLVMALALVHHLALGHNLPLPKLARFFSRLAPWLIIEFVPKTDPNAQTLLQVREDIFPRYTQAEFEREFAQHFTLEQTKPIPESQRVLYLLRRRDGPTP